MKCIRVLFSICMEQMRDKYMNAFEDPEKCRKIEKERGWRSSGWENWAIGKFSSFLLCPVFWDCLQFSFFLPLALILFYLPCARAQHFPIKWINFNTNSWWLGWSDQLKTMVNIHITVSIKNNPYHMHKIVISITTWLLIQLHTRAWLMWRVCVHEQKCVAVIVFFSSVVYIKQNIYITKENGVI